jgi:hypothetical protein
MVKSYSTSKIVGWVVWLTLLFSIAVLITNVYIYLTICETHGIPWWPIW